MKCYYIALNFITINCHVWVGWFLSQKTEIPNPSAFRKLIICYKKHSENSLLQKHKGMKLKNSSKLMYFVLNTYVTHSFHFRCWKLMSYLYLINYTSTGKGFRIVSALLFWIRYLNTLTCLFVIVQIYKTIRKSLFLSSVHCMFKYKKSVCFYIASHTWNKNFCSSLLHVNLNV